MLAIHTTLFLVSGFVLAVTHALSISLYLYWRYWWLDIPMHLLGGVVIGLLPFALRELHVVSSTWWTSTRGVLITVFVVAVGWECFELVAGIPIEDDYIIDTVTDLCMGFLGATIAVFIARKFKVWL